jgi:HK97 family phage prohead protease
MPWHIVPESGKCPASKPYAVIKDSDGSLAGCHATKQQAQKQLAALYANETTASGKGRLQMTDTDTGKDGAVIRAFKPGIELRAAEDGGMPTLHGHFAIFNRFTEIDSWMEGHFLERIMPGAFKKTFQENRSTVKALFQHGQDPQIGDKPLGPVERLEEDTTGAYYEVPMIDTAYNRDLIPGLEAGLYGASFRFNVTREEIDEEPERSDANPDGIPERSIKELRLFEFGPVTFPAYAEATAGVRSFTDHFLFEMVERDPARVRELLESLSDAATRSTSDRKSDAATPRTSDKNEETVRTWPTVTDEEWSALWNL